MSMSTRALIVAVASCTGAHASAATYEFPHVFEASATLTNTPLGSTNLPYQAVHGHGFITISDTPSPPHANEYAYDEHPHFILDLNARSLFDVEFEGLGGFTIQDPEDESTWILTISYRPIVHIGEVEYRMPGDGVLTFIKDHADPQPLDLGLGGSEELRHGTPVVLLFENPITLFAGGDPQADSFLTFDGSSRLVIESAIPAPGTMLAFAPCLLAACRRSRSAR